MYRANLDIIMFSYTNNEMPTTIVIEAFMRGGLVRVSGGGGLIIIVFILNQLENDSTGRPASE